MSVTVLTVMSRSPSRWESCRARHPRSLPRGRAHGANRKAHRISFYSQRLSALMWNPKLDLILSRHETFLSSVSYLGCLHCDLAGRFGCRSEGQDGRYGRWNSDRKAGDIPWFLERLSNEELVFLLEASLGPQHNIDVECGNSWISWWNCGIRPQKPENFVTVKAWRGNSNGCQVWVLSSLDSAVGLWQSPRERLGSDLGIAIFLFWPWGLCCAAWSFRALSRDSQLRFSRPALTMTDCQVLCLGRVADYHCIALFPSNLYQQVTTPQGVR